MLLKVFDRLCSIMKITIYKFLYLSNLKASKIYMGKGSSLRISNKHSKLVVGNGFYARSNVHLRISNGRLEIGKRFFMNDNCGITCREKVVIGDDCLLGQNVYIYDHDHEFRKEGNISEQGFNCKPVTIGNNVWIGSNSIILKGVTIGDNVVIAAGSIITKDIPPNSIARNTIKLEVTKLENPF